MLYPAQQHIPRADSPNAPDKHTPYRVLRRIASRLFAADDLAEGIAAIQCRLDRQGRVRIEVAYSRNALEFQKACEYYLNLLEMLQGFRPGNIGQAGTHFCVTMYKPFLHTLIGLRTDVS